MWPYCGGDSVARVAPVSQYQSVQKSREALEVRLVAARPLTPGEEAAIRGLIHGEVGSAFAIAFTYVDEIARSKGGKFEDFRSEIAAAPPPASVLAAMAQMGIDVTHVYGLTESYGPAVACAWHKEWCTRPPEEQANLKSRQGVKYPVLEDLMVADAQTLEPVPRDGTTIGEVFMRGNIVMKGYLKNPDANGEAFAGGWFHSGDLGVRHRDGYIQLKDRSKDIIISGGENISSIEIEDVLYKHPGVALAAVVARADDKWGETPCAFIELKAGAEPVSQAEIVAYCRENLTGYKVPKAVEFRKDLPKSNVGKILRRELREDLP